MGDVLKQDNLFAGGTTQVTVPIKIAVSQTVKRGDILKNGAGGYSKPTLAVTASDDVVIASEDVTTDGTNTKATIGYRNGEFNEFSIGYPGSTTADDNRAVLATKSIYLKKAVRA